MFVLNFFHDEKLAIEGVLLDERVTVGRSSGNNVVLPDPSVSRRHAVFLVEPTQDGSAIIVLQDLGSTNGCEVNGTVFRGKRVRVQPGDDVRLGTYRVEILRRTPKLPDLVEDGERTIIYQGPPLSHESLPLDRLRALHELTACSAALSLEGLLEATWKTVVSCLRFDVLCVVVHEAGRDEIVRTWNAKGSCPPSSVPVSRKLLSKCLKENLAVLADKRLTDGPKSPDDSGILNSLSCAMCVPIAHGDWNLGALYVASNTQGVVYDKDDLQFLILVAHQLSNTLANRKAMNDLRVEAKKLEAILASLQEGVIVADQDFVVLSANSAARKALGNADVLSKTMEEALADFEHTFDRRTIGERRRFQIGPARVAKPGTAGPRIYSATVSENVEREGGSWKYVVCLHDVTHVERTERLKSIFVNRLAHKLRTPLTVISGVNALIHQQARDALDPELRELLVQSVENADQCAALIERFVEYTSLNLGDDSTGAWEPCKIETLVMAAAESNAELAAQKGFSIETKFPEETFQVLGKPQNLALVFHHIVQNAVKFGYASGRLEVFASESRGTVKTSFRDDGPGIPVAELENLCQMLHQVDVENTGQVPGAGLGLWLARAILNSCRGDIRVTSPADESGHGTLVEILLPAYHPSAEEDAGRRFHRAVTETVQLE
ncbi:MAG: FHA domain-containing protein [Planctomycetota bacterium]